ncbi:probable histone deacetylase 19 [Miscanthus floridulus]|uniref:probable histone deacetylase 19 n=1 Tax=Miscanthus floridulus TaxID=154761 RepID=UPI0034576F50
MSAPTRSEEEEAGEKNRKSQLTRLIPCCSIPPSSRTADQDDLDERHDPDSDMEVDDHKAVDESARRSILGINVERIW